MKKLLAIAAAGAIAFAGLTATAAPSLAAPGDWKGKWQGQGWKGNNNWNKFGDRNWSDNWKGNWKGPKHFPKHGYYPKFPKHFPKHHHHHFNAAPFFFGFALGALATGPYYHSYAGLSPHQIWCLKRYPNSYNPATNLYFTKHGPRVCVSPYSGFPVPY